MGKKLKQYADLSLDNILNWLGVGIKKSKKYIVIMLLLLWQGCKINESVSIKGFGKVTMNEGGRKVIIELEKGFWEEIFKKPVSINFIKEFLDS